MLVRFFVVMMCSVVLAGCQTTSVNTSYDSNYAEFDQYGVPIVKAKKQNTVNYKNDLWQVTRSKLQFEKSYTKRRVVKEIKYYNRYPLHMVKVSQQAKPYYHYVLSEVLKRGYPSEVALLPVIESLYNPNAYSYGKASGIWQFIPSTATYLGVDINNWYDGRRDIITSTQTALDYLARLNKRFDGDWMLTFAAYNGGGGTVSKAMRINREKGLPTDYWSLKLPSETTQYVPRLLAIAAIVENPSKYKIKIPTIADKPYFKVIKIKGQIDLGKAAKIAKVSKATLLKLNSGFSRKVTAPNGPHRLIIPVSTPIKSQAALSSLGTKERLDYLRYTIKSGDSLGTIAQQFNSSIKDIKNANSLAKSSIKIGKVLLIPTYGDNPKTTLVSTSKKHKLHKINNGDTVWDIAKKHKLSVKKILAFNGLSQNSTLRVGSSLKIPRG